MFVKKIEGLKMKFEIFIENKNYVTKRKPVTIAWHK